MNNNKRSANSKPKEETAQKRPIRNNKPSQNNDDLDNDNTTQTTQTTKTSSKTQTNASKKNQQTQNKNTDKNTDKTNTKTNKQEEKQPKPKRVVPTSTHFIGIFGGGILKNTDYIIVKDDNKYGIDEYYRKLKNIYEFNDSIKKFYGKVFYVMDSEDVYDKFITYCDNTEDGEEKDKIRYKDISDFNDDILNHIHLIHATSSSYIVNKIREICNNVCKPYPERIISVKPRQKKTNDVAPKQSSAQKQNVQDTDNSDNPILTANIQKSNNTKRNKKQAAVIASDEEENNDEENNDSDEASELVDDNNDDNNEEDEDNNEEDDDN